MTAPLVLQLSNEPTLTDGSRFVRAFGALASEGLLAHTAVSPVALLPAGFAQALEGTRAAVRGLRPDVVFVQSPGAFFWTPTQVRELLASLGDPPVVCWEGDAWGGRKRIPSGTAAWLGEATAVFSVALGPQSALLGQHTDAPVRYVPNVLPLPCDESP
ncbi:hypothetical protein P8605_35390, partial [Streptomyces sp. T-3]|nr:hypothetical protein [Streptomyces sp. T-3]